MGRCVVMPQCSACRWPCQSVQLALVVQLERCSGGRLVRSASEIVGRGGVGAWHVTSVSLDTTTCITLASQVHSARSHH